MEKMNFNKNIEIDETDLAITFQDDFVQEGHKETARGVFWVIENRLFAYPFYHNATDGIAKSGVTFNHKKLWPSIKPKGCNQPYNYYPRGRVDFDNKGRPIIYLNPNIVNFVPQIRQEFGLRTEPKIFPEHSDHYKCYLDNGWKPD